MDWREKVMWGAVGLVLVSWGLEIFDVWSLLIADLTRSNWITCVLICRLLGLIGASTNASQRNEAASSNASRYGHCDHELVLDLLPHRKSRRRISTSHNKN